jgi:hypothetical protein
MFDRINTLFRRLFSHAVNYGKLVVLSPDFLRSDRYKNARQWGENRDEIDKVANRDLILQQAEARYAERVEGMKALDDKVSELLKFNGTMAMALFAAIRVAQMPTSGWLQLSFVCLGLSMLGCLVARKALLKPTRPAIPELVRACSTVDNPKDLLISSLHMSVEGMQAVADSVAAKFNLASLLTVVAIASLLISLLLGPI